MSAETSNRTVLEFLALEDHWAIGAKLAAPAPEQFWRLVPRPPAGKGSRRTDR